MNVTVAERNFDTKTTVANKMKFKITKVVNMPSRFKNIFSIYGLYSGLLPIKIIFAPN